MLFGIISDTHGHVRNTTEGLQLLAARGVERILHCGAIGSSAIPGLFSTPTHFVFGNVDHDVVELRLAIANAGHTCHERFGELTFAGVKIALLHGDDSRRFETTAKAGVWDLVCYGHTHRRESRYAGKTLLLNPGAVFRATPHTVATIELERRAVEFLEF